jgi:hypothetical protein
MLLLLLLLLLLWWCYNELELKWVRFTKVPFCIILLCHAIGLGEIFRSHSVSVENQFVSVV